MPLRWEDGQYGLSSKYSAGRFLSHSAMNDLVKRALQKAGVPSVLKPPGLDRGDASRTDGIKVFPFSGSRSLVWDCTCVNTFAGVHLSKSAMEAGIAADSTEERKRREYAALAEAHQFEPIANWEANWFRQNLAIAIQRGNAFSILSAARKRFRGSGESSSTQPLTLFLREFLLP